MRSVFSLPQVVYCLLFLSAGLEGGKELRGKALLVFGDADAVRPAHAVQLFELLGGGKKDGGWDGSGMSNARLAILHGLTHYSIFSSPAVPAWCDAFLDAPMPGAK